MIVEKKRVILEKGRDMSQTRFLEWLNENFKKESGAPFTEQDAFGYIERGNIPIKFGYYSVTRVDEPETGLRIITVVQYK